MTTSRPESAEGPESDLPVIGPITVGPVAHGGHCVARHDGRVIFVRHALPGEQVRVKITDDSHPNYWRADAVEVVEASPDRIEAACPISGPGGCGGCDFQHVELAAQRELKTAVLAEQLQRLAGLDLQVPVEEVPLDGFPGFGWRTRVRYLADDHGRLGLRAHRSHRVIALPDEGCLIAAPEIAHPPPELAHPHPELVHPHPELVHPHPELVEGPSESASTSSARVGSESSARVGSESSARGDELIGVAAADGTHWFAPGQRESITEHAVGRDWQVAGDGFWQVHPAAADLLTGAVIDGLQPEAGETVFDLYCGVGLFTGAMVDRGCQVTGVESSRSAIAAARRNLAGSSARFVADRVDRALARATGRRQGRGRGGRAMPQKVDLVVLDPPRSGAGRAVVEQIVRRRPRAVAYVACDPAALARDLRYLSDHGYALESLRAFDLFPMTHHLECVAILRPAGSA